LNREVSEKLQLEQDRLKNEAEKKRLSLEERLLKEAEEKLHIEVQKLKKETQNKLDQEQERLRKEAEEKNRLQAERLRAETENIIRQQEQQLKKDSEAKLRLEQSRLQKEAEEKLRQEQEKIKREEQEAKIRHEEKQKKIGKQVEKSKDRIISQTETTGEYQLFDMCPFVIAQTGKGISIGFGESKNRWQHGRCMQEYCRLWTWKTDEKGEPYAQGCALQFLGLSPEEISWNFSIKNRQILDNDES